MISKTLRFQGLSLIYMRLDVPDYFVTVSFSVYYLLFSSLGSMIWTMFTSLEAYDLRSLENQEYKITSSTIDSFLELNWTFIFAIVYMVFTCHIHLW